MSSPELMDAFFNTRAEGYDDHMLKELGLDIFYEEIAAQLAPFSIGKLLDLGCGTGLQLKRLFEQWPELEVTGIDLSDGMLSILKSKYKDRKLKLILGSYFDVPFQEESFDAVLSTYSLHHFPKEQKQELYQKICNALKPGGVFLLGDYTVKTLEEESLSISESERLHKEASEKGGAFHFDTPFTAETETLLMKNAGFQNIRVARQWDSTTIFVAIK